MKSVSKTDNRSQDIHKLIDPNLNTRCEYCYMNLIVCRSQRCHNTIELSQQVEVNGSKPFNCCNEQNIKLVAFALIIKPTDCFI